jgi:hypothetical protein
MGKVLGFLFFLVIVCHCASRAQIISFPYSEGFEATFITGTNVDFIPNWNGNTVQTASRIFRDGTNMRTGTGALGVVPISSFNGTIIVNLSFATLTNAVASFWARSVQNSTGSRPAIVNFSVSTDGGVNYSAATQIGVDTTFPNQTTPYVNYIYNFPSASFLQPNIKLKIVVSQGSSGSGTTAEFAMDDFQVSGTTVADVTPPAIVSTNVLSSNQLDIKFSEGIEQTSAESSANYSVDNGIGNPSSAMRDASDFTLVHLAFAGSFTSGVTNTITVNNVSDFSANSIGANSPSQFTYNEIATPDSGDVIINEVLFHAESGGKEFVELYNRSHKYFDLRDIYFRDLTYSNPSFPITSTRRILAPGEYVAITEDTNDVISRYFVPNHNSLIQSPNLPTFTDAGDTVRIYKDSTILLDRLVYSEEWQFPLLNSTTGISLERLNPNRATQDSTNWHSAAENVRATPGYKNSQYNETSDDGTEIQIEPETFSPDEDGKDDNVNIHFHFSTPGYVATIQVFDAKGRLIRKLISNELIGNDGTFSWDGLTDKKEKARIGIYIFYIEVFNLEGSTKSYKRTCVLASKF